MKFLYPVILCSVSLLSCGIERNNSSDTWKNNSSDTWKNNSNSDFCECVILLDSINNETERGAISPAEMDALMRRWEMLEEQCETLTAHDNSTPESRAAYEKRVNECLGKK